MTIKVTTMLLKGLALKYSLIAFVLLTVFTLATAMLHAQTPAERVTTGIDTSERAPITGTRPTSANPANDVGPVPLAAKLQGINIVFRRSTCLRSSFAGIDCGPAKSSFAALLPMAHTRAVCAQFGVSESDISKVVTSLPLLGVEPPDGI